MDKDTRNTLRNVVTRCRQLLEEAVAQVLEGQYGVYASGRVEDAAKMDHLMPDELDIRGRIVAHLEHIQSGGFKPADAADQLIREIAFTHLNRLAAYKMMEPRGLIREAVSRGLDSQGFKFYLAYHPDDERLWSTGQQELAYRHFLVWQGEQFADEISVLFSPYDPANFVFPPQRVLDQVLDLINSAELADIWTADETIGWVYQYFTPKELRDKARSESQAPRNSYELAFRNQFYTPRYVVEFLTDNTLGRTWYEMRQGQTVLVEQCRYLVRRPNEIFLAQGENAPESDIDTSALSQEELLQQPVYIPYRALKDPRRLKVLDPACGSGHFLLYAFDLLATIYEEAWQNDLTDSLGMNLRDDYDTLDRLRCNIPRLILAVNLHGIDIDRRATQIAALALWLRAQRYYNDHTIDRKNRPAITQGNIVVAESMPGDRALLDEFVAQLEPPIDQMVKRVFNEMKLAGEAGSLLKIEEAIQDDIARAREEWERRFLREKTPQQMALLPDWVEKKLEQLTLFDVSKITDAEFFDRAEHMVLEALEAYAQRAENGYGLRRRLFADDAAGGFAFIELMRQRYDVVLMNPPFGANAKEANEYIAGTFPSSKQDIAYAFVERGLDILHEGYVGCIATRTGFFLATSEDWRTDILDYGSRLSAVLDLGYGVLDALVETAAYVVEKNSPNFWVVFIDVLQEIDKVPAIQHAISTNNSKSFHLVDSSNFRHLPNAIFAYWPPPSLLQVYGQSETFEPTWGVVKRGVATGDNDRFLRLIWEVHPKEIGPGSYWIWYAKGGEYSPYFIGTHLLLNWNNNGYEIKNFYDNNGRLRSRPQNIEYFFQPGLAYASRTTSGFGPRVLHSESGFDQTSNPIFLKPEIDKYAVLALLLTRPILGYVELAVGSGDTSQSGTAARDYTNGMVGTIPIPDLTNQQWNKLSELGKSIVRLTRCGLTFDEIAAEFIYPASFSYPGKSVRARLRNRVLDDLERALLILKATFEADEISLDAFGITPEARAFLDDFVGLHPYAYGTRESHDSNPARVLTKKSFWADRNLEVKAHRLQKHPSTIIGDNDFVEQRIQDLSSDGYLDILSYPIGLAFGRWDIRYAIGERPIPELPDPFDPLPVCPPGMLQNADGLPATETPPGYPLDIDWDGILVDDSDHPDDIIRRVRGVLEVLWGDRAEAIEQEACEILGVKTLRDYFRKSGSGGFWDDHIKRYSKSRRNAPIYWLLQSSRKNYALWLYYHRLDKDLYYKALINYVQPKLRLEQNNLTALRAQLAGAGVAGSEAKRLEREVEQQEALMSELQDFHDALEHAAQLNLEPDLNDGVVLNIAPLHELVPWKEAATYWKALLKGEYEWSTISQQLRERGLVK